MRRQNTLLDYIALAEIIWVKSSDKFDIVWRDRKEGKSDNISQTEFTVSDTLSTSDYEDDFLYKVIVYLSTGKVMIQGREWQHFGDHVFEKCLQNIVRTIDGHDQTSLKEGFLTSPNDNLDQEIELYLQHSNDNATVPMSTCTLETKSTVNQVSQNTSDDDTKLQSVEDAVQKMLNPIKNSMSVLEGAIVDIKTTISNWLANNQDYKDILTKELKNLGKTVSQSPTYLNNNVLEKQLKEKKWGSKKTYQQNWRFVKNAWNTVQKITIRVQFKRR